MADLYGDGAPEVIADEAVLDGATGATVARLSSAQLYRSPTPADLDGDGVMEIVLGPDVYDAAGTPLWSTSSPATSDVFVALVQADGDASAELAFVDDDGYHLYDTDGLPILSAGLPSGQPYAYPGPPCVADFDGDGAPELGVATYDYFTVLELDGTLVWSVGVRDWGPKGCSGFDFDEDGAAEVIYADLLTLYVLDGRTGATLWSWADYSDNGQGSEYAFVADIDADGVAEIVTGVNDGPAQGVRVFGQVVGDWPGAGPAWGVHDFSETNQDDDGGVPASPTPPWDLGVFRARPTRASATADLTVSITDVCVADCEFGPVRLAIQVANQGAVTVAAGAEVEVVALDSTGERRVATVTLPEIAAGTRAVAAEVDLNPADVGALGFAAVIDVGGRIRECDETNNRDDWTEFFCP